MGKTWTVESQRCYLPLEILFKTFTMGKIEVFSISVAPHNYKCYLNLCFLFSFTTIIFLSHCSFEEANTSMKFWGTNSLMMCQDV